MSPFLSEQTIISHDFTRGRWDKTVDLKDFIQTNIAPYDGDEGFLCGPTERTERLWKRCTGLLEAESRRGGLLGADPEKVSTITSHAPGYIAREEEIIVGLQTDAPLKRGIKPQGGVRTVRKALEEENYRLNTTIDDFFSRYAKTHNDTVFQTYTEEIKKARRHGLLTGLPDSYGRGRIIGDYRRPALYGIDYLAEQKSQDLKALEEYPFDEEIIRLRQETAEQIEALQEMKAMAAAYGFDISRPAENARQAVQWTYFAYLAAVKEQDGAAMSLGSVSAFFDIFIERDIGRGLLTEEGAQELIDDFIIKLRLVRHLRSRAYAEIFAGDPTWITEAIGGMLDDGRHKVTKTAYRILQTLYNLGPSPEPNLTVLWSPRLPAPFKHFAARTAAATSSLQFENDELMRPLAGDDYGIACCVSLQELGKSIQFFGARCNLPKALLLALNGGREEFTGELLVPGIDPLPPGVLEIDHVKERFHRVLQYTAKLYVETMNIIHAVHDRTYYERAQMALIDTFMQRTMAFGIAGLSVVADSLSAIRYTEVTARRDSRGLTTGFRIAGDYPAFGNDDRRVDGRAVDIVKIFKEELEKHTIYRKAVPTLSILTITSNIMYGKKTGATPDGRKSGEPFAPGANPMHGRDRQGALSSLNSVARIPYSLCLDGISNTFSVIPAVLGSGTEERLRNLTALLDGYFAKGGHHLNINVLDPETLRDAMENPERYPQLTIRVSGYAVRFTRLSRVQQEEVLARTFHGRLS